VAFNISKSSRLLLHAPMSQFDLHKCGRNLKFGNRSIVTAPFWYSVLISPTQKHWQADTARSILLRISRSICSETLIAGTAHEL